MPERLRQVTENVCLEPLAKILYRVYSFVWGLRVIIVLGFRVSGLART